MKPALGFLALYMLSLAGIMAGYSDLSSFFDSGHWQIVVKNAPVLRTAFALTLERVIDL
jgi:hypothetical protein